MYPRSRSWIPGRATKGAQAQRSGKDGTIAGAAMDVVEGEAPYFFRRGIRGSLLRGHPTACPVEVVTRDLFERQTLSLSAMPSGQGLLNKLHYG